MRRCLLLAALAAAACRPPVKSADAVKLACGDFALVIKVKTACAPASSRCAARWSLARRDGLLSRDADEFPRLQELPPYGETQVIAFPARAPSAARVEPWDLAFDPRAFAPKELADSADCLQRNLAAVDAALEASAAGTETPAPRLRSASLRPHPPKRPRPRPRP
jgi:hypothetical protein